MKIPIVALCLSCAPLVQAAPPTNTLSPEAVVQLTLAHHPTLKSRYADVQMATARRFQADAGLNPTLDARAQAQHFEGLENGSLAPGVTLPVMEDQYTASIGITQPLYTGGRVIQQRRSTKFQEAAARHTLTATASDIELQARIAYWQWSKALSQITAFEASVIRMEAQLADTRNLKNAGMATDNDLLANEVLLDQIQLQLQSAQQEADLSRIKLTQLTGQDITVGHTPLPPDVPTTAMGPGLQEALNMALSNRPELASVRLTAHASAELVGAARAEGKPQITLMARYEQGNPNPRDFPPEDQWRDDAFIGAAVTWNIFDGGLTRARTAEAKARAARDKYQAETLLEAVIADTKAACLSRDYALARLKTAKHAETSAIRNLEVATDLWKNGAARHSDVLDAQAKLTLTTAQRIAAEAEALIAKAALDHAIHWHPL